MAYDKLNLTDNVDKWTSDKVEHLEDGFLAIAQESTEYLGCFYRVVNDETEWINPPMISGVEYKTTQRYMGEPVYCKVVEYTNTASFGAADTAKAHNVPHGISNYNRAVFVRGFYGGTSSYPLPYRSQAGGFLYIGQISTSNIVLQSYNWAVAADTEFRFEMYYIK